jgi:hypothetical protein
MSKALRGLAWAALVSLLVLGGSVRGDDRPAMLETGKLAPALEVGQWKNSKELKLGDLAGKVVILDFWGVW